MEIRKGHEGVFQQPDHSLQHHLALRRSVASILGTERAILRAERVYFGIFITLSLLDTHSGQCSAGRFP
jgi:hypothetical protein